MVDVIVERCAGLDVHRDTVVATVRLPGKGKSRRRRLQETRTFGTTIGQLERDLTRLRSTQVQERTRAIERPLEKVLQDAGIKLTSVASGVYSVSARAMLEALLAGVTDPFVLAELAKGRMRKKIPQLQEALASRFDIGHTAFSSRGCSPTSTRSTRRSPRSRLGSTPTPPRITT